MGRSKLGSTNSEKPIDDYLFMLTTDWVVCTRSVIDHRAHSYIATLYSKPYY